MNADFLKVSVNELIGETAIINDDKVFEWRFRRAVKLCTTAGYFVDLTDDDKLDITLPDALEDHPPQLVAGGYLLIPRFQNNHIEINSRRDFVEIVENVEERAIKENSSFDTNFKWFMRNFYERTKQATIDALKNRQAEKIRKSEEVVAKAGFKPISAVWIGADTNEM